MAELEQGYRVVHIDEAGGAVDEDAVLAFWEREGAMPSGAAARERVGEVAFVGIDERDQLAAVSTVYLKHNQRLGMELWHTRGFVGRDHRQSGLGERFARVITAHYRELFVSGRDTRGPGMIMEIESEIVKRVYDQAVWPGPAYTFIGEGPGGEHIRVLYFPGALAPPPPS